MAALAGDTHPRDENPRNRYEPWRETPDGIDLANNGHAGRDTIFALYGLSGCNGGRGNFHDREIGAALGRRGSYYTVTQNKEGIIIVIPRSRLAAYYYVG
jgi:hypothetical protein